MPAIDPQKIVWDDEKPNPKAVKWDGERSPSYNEGKTAPGSFQGLMSALQGPSLGFADEIVAALAAPGKSLVNNMSLAENYRDTRDYLRGAADAQEQQNPIFTAITRAAAGAPLMALNKAKAAAGMLPNVLQATKVGAITGGIGGLGSSDKETISGQALDAAKSASIGAAMSAVAVPVASGMGNMYENVAGRFSDSAAAKYAQQKVAEALVRDARGVYQDSPQAVVGQASARLNKLGPEGRVVDAAGQNARQLLDTLSTLPGQTKGSVETAIAARQAGRADRLRDAAQTSLNASGARLSPTIDSLLEKRSADAAPLYDALYKRGVFITDELKGIIDAAQKLGAGSEAKRIATAKQVDFSLSPDAKWVGMRDLDYLKQGLDDIIAANKNEFGKLTKVGAAVQGLKNDLVGVLDLETKGLYRKAREAFAGPSALLDAAREGRMVLSQDDTAITKALSGLTAGEKEAFRLGAYEALRAKLGNMSGQNEILRMWRDKTTSEKLKALFGDERSFREFASTVAAESRMKGLESVGRGSQTAARQYGAGDLDVPAAAEAVQTIAGANNPVGMLTAAARAWNRVQTPEPVRDQMGRILLSQGTAGRNELARLLESVNAVQAQRAAQANALGIGAGQLAPNALAVLSAPR